MTENAIGSSSGGGKQYELKYDFFVYGTLCVPAVLKRVLGRECNDLTFQDAILPGYTRHCVKGEDYPAIVDRRATDTILGHQLEEEENITRGTFVSGLTIMDVRALDIFEGDEYKRRKVVVRTLYPPSTVHEVPNFLAHPEIREPVDTPQSQASPTARHQKEERACWIYAWSASLDRLEPKIWKFDDFMRDKARYWVSADTTEYDEVDQHRSLRSGDI